MNPHCRIGRVWMKLNQEPRGREHYLGVQVIERPTEDEEHRVRMLRNAREMASFFPGKELAGFVLIGWDARMEYSVGFEVWPESKLPRTLLPAFLSEALRREMGYRDVLDALTPTSSPPPPDSA